MLTQTYGYENLEVFLINNAKDENGNEADDGSFKLFQDFQTKHSKMKIWWLSSSKGKASALNKGLYNSSGKYILNIDSDGWLDKNAINNIVKRFESNNNIQALTGTILIDPKQIKDNKTQSLFMKILRKAEFAEYVESFLIGRNYESSKDSLYTLAGAFSAFRREAIFKTQLYNPQTLGEDTHMTFQIKNFIGGRIELCEDSFLFVDPIDSVSHLYSQRQRWQRSSMEIAMMFNENHSGKFLDLFKKASMRILLKDHSIAFLNLFWTFSFIYFYYVGYPFMYFLISNTILYTIYVVNSIVYNRLAITFMDTIPEVKKYHKKNIIISFAMIPYRILNYIIRIAGIINSLTVDASWFPGTVFDEIRVFKKSMIPKFLQSSIYKNK